MPAFPPDFNIDAFIWRTPIVPPGTPDVDTDCQLYIASRGLVDITPGDSTAWVPPIYLRVPALTDIRPTDQVECPQHSGRMYSVRWVEDAHKGFPNEYRVGLLEQTSQPFPLP
jgi:hypothetical protein